MSSFTENAAGPLERLKAGDKQALADLFEQHRDRLHRLIIVRLDERLTRRIDVDDVLQEVYIDAAARLHHYIESHSGSFFIWLRLVATQTMANIFRRHIGATKRNASLEISLESQRPVGEQLMPVAVQLLGQLTSPSDAAMREETAKRLEAVIESLKPMDREVIMLRHFELLDNKEVAEVLGLSQKASSIRYVRAISRLREAIVEIPGLVEESE